MLVKNFMESNICLYYNTVCCNKMVSVWILIQAKVIIQVLLVKNNTGEKKNPYNYVYIYMYNLYYSQRLTVWWFIAGEFGNITKMSRIFSLEKGMQIYWRNLRFGLINRTLGWEIWSWKIKVIQCGDMWDLSWPSLMVL